MQQLTGPPSQNICCISEPLKHCLVRYAFPSTFLRVWLPHVGSWLLWVPGPRPSGVVQAGNGFSPPVCAQPQGLWMPEEDAPLSVGLRRELEAGQSPFLFSTWPLKSPNCHHTWFYKCLPWRVGAFSDGNAGMERLNLAANQDSCQRSEWNGI